MQWVAVHGPPGASYDEVAEATPVFGTADENVLMGGGGACVAVALLHVIVRVWYCMLWYYILVLHVLSTPKYDTERLVWSEDIMRFDTVLM